MAEQNRLALLNEELEQVSVQRETLRNKHRGETMPEEARREDEELVSRATKIARAIEIEKQRERDAVFSDLTNYFESPATQIRHPVNSDDESRGMLAKAGWETKGGFVTRMTSSGREQAMYPEEVLWGPMPSANDPAAGYFRQTRAIFQPEYRNAYVKWLMARTANDSLAMSRLTAAEQNALSEGADTSGGFLVPPDIQAEILARTAQMAVMRRLATIQPTARDIIQFPAVTANSTSGSIYSSGFVGGWAGETPAFSDTDPAFEQFNIPIKKLRVATKLSNDWLSDAAANMLAFMSQNGAQNLALVEDNGFISGNGTALQPRGLLNSGISTIDVEGSTANTISNTTASTGSGPKILDVEYGVPAQYANNGAWLMRRATEGKVRKLVDANGRPLYASYNESGFGSEGRLRAIDTYPVYNSDFMDADGADTNKVIVFGDFRNYIIGQRAAISTVVLRERFADTDQTGIILFERVGGGGWNTDAFRSGVV